jgi:hypothetical protein
MEHLLSLEKQEMYIAFLLDNLMEGGYLTDLGICTRGRIVRELSL